MQGCFVSNDNYDQDKQKYIEDLNSMQVITGNKIVAFASLGAMLLSALLAIIFWYYKYTIPLVIANGLVDTFLVFYLLQVAKPCIINIIVCLVLSAIMIGVTVLAFLLYGSVILDLKFDDVNIVPYLALFLLCVAIPFVYFSQELNFSRFFSGRIYKVDTVFKLMSIVVAMVIIWGACGFIMYSFITHRIL
ncbi:MAG: hypothetical protein FWF56_03330 [Firmicutes bacterium]|nr:hypothetical protein [Bacillota bacterium]